MAHWIIEERGFGGSFYKCSACGKVWNDIFSNVWTEDNCPVCGAPMNEETVYIDEEKIAKLEKKLKNAKVHQELNLYFATDGGVTMNVYPVGEDEEGCEKTYTEQHETMVEDKKKVVAEMVNKIIQVPQKPKQLKATDIVFKDGHREPIAYCSGFNNEFIHFATESGVYVFKARVAETTPDIKGVTCKYLSTRFYRCETGYDRHHDELVTVYNSAYDIEHIEFKEVEVDD